MLVLIVLYCNYLWGFAMVTIGGIKYLTCDEAAERYGMSKRWFELGRNLGYGPPYKKLRGKGKVLYQFDVVEKWFVDNLVDGE